jgi:hypothetical protein
VLRLIVPRLVKFARRKKETATPETGNIWNSFRHVTYRIHRLLIDIGHRDNREKKLDQVVAVKYLMK